jgi:hypothetical protein
MATNSVMVSDGSLDHDVTEVVCEVLGCEVLTAAMLYGYELAAKCNFTQLHTYIHHAQGTPVRFFIFIVYIFVLPVVQTMVSSDE